ncbi:MAG: NfeD family protein, partial [Gemmatimonadota bacterium]
PGGRVDAAERIADDVQDASVPVYAFVNRRAFSAGALIALATDEIFMLPGSVIGAATPVVGSGERAPEKIVSAMRSEMRALAEARGLDPAVAEAMVDENIEVPAVVEAGRLLTLTTDEAAELGYATRIESLGAALDLMGLPGATVEDREVNWAERMVRFFTHPAVSPFLLSLGFLGLVIEIKSPGLGLAGAAGVVALALFFGSHHLLGLAGIEDMLLVGAGMGLVALEVFVIPGFGIFGILGGIGILAGIYLSLLGSLPTMPDLTQASLVLTVTLLVVIVTGWALIRRLPGSGRLARSGVFLLTETERADGYESSLRRPELVGKVGTAATDLRPAGTGVFEDERLDVVAESQWIEAGTPIRIVSAEGYRHVVRPVEVVEGAGAEVGEETPA